MKLEICANSYQSAKNAAIAGADRIELCSELSIGGITPSYGTLQQVSNEITLPVNVLVRPRSGDFCYTDKEFEVMKSNILICKKLGFNGIVSGILKTDDTIDIERTQELITLAKPLTFTFHRAFDCVPNPKEALLQLMNLGGDCILTSGQQAKAENGIELLKELQEIAQDKLTLLIGGGVNPTNAKTFKKEGFQEIHASASKNTPTESSIFFGNTPQTVSDIQTIKDILNAIKNV